MDHSKSNRRRFLGSGRRHRESDQRQAGQDRRQLLALCATTAFDYIRRAMPYDHPRSLSPDEIYSSVAYILFMNGIVTETQELNANTLPQVKMPNRDSFYPALAPGCEIEAVK